ncbi:hypothetical protein AB4Y32_00840 [Paraburkholderia phymatum]|uniref:Uncharacterized protein n=1 Tax=Paraburkholderia phymatum TaxID=148447 RepID=A0ACC6TSN4_9BURK
MATNIKLPGSEIIDFNLKVEIEAKYFYGFATWTPVMGALLMSGIVPTDHWRKVLDSAESANKSASFWTDQLRRLIYELWENDGTGAETIPERNRKHLRGLDGETQATTASTRFQNAHRVLRHWGEKCEDEGQYLSEVEPVIFVAWLEELCLYDEILFFDRTWLDAFLKLHGLGATKIVLPASVVESFLKVTDIGDDGGWHPLGSDILKAQREAISRGSDPYAIEIIFPIVSRILDDRGAINRSSEKYESGRVLPVTLEDGGPYVLKRDSLRVQLGRLKSRRYTSP